ncbi:MAG: hypothetical protein GY827_02000 [Cytophagales bacterium]|nr:hypothetical protein [Cytophagales bacterium]
MGEKKKFLVEFEIQEDFLSKYYYYLSTAEGLSKWMADDVEQVEEKIFKLVWNQQVHYAKIVKQKANKYIKFEFLNENMESESNPSILDFSLKKNEMTEVWYFIVDEYSDFQDEQGEFEEDWLELGKQLEYLVTG